MAVGRDQIRDWAIGIEMDGLDGWHYDYQATVIDEKNGMIVGFWKQKSGIVDDATGQEFEILGIGGSWFGVERQTSGEDAGSLKFSWQRDWFDMVCHYGGWPVGARLNSLVEDTISKAQKSAQKSAQKDS